MVKIIFAKIKEKSATSEFAIVINNHGKIEFGINNENKIKSAEYFFREFLKNKSQSFEENLDRIYNMLLSNRGADIIKDKNELVSQLMKEINSFYEPDNKISSEFL